jgi:serine/threonine-protein kinase
LPKFPDQRKEKAFMPGRVFLGRYETIRLLGEGGMGKVYLARHLELDEPVVVKVMHEHIASNPLFRERFKREMRLMARFKHPHSVICHDASLEEPLGPCIIMEYLPGATLDRLLAKNARFSPTRAHRLVSQLCDVLQAAHDFGIVHRDLKPANLMVLDPDTPNEKIKVMDFGLAQAVDAMSPQDDKSTHVPSEYAVGTPGYMSPEQVRGEAVDHRSDLYSVGAILFQLLTGRLPFGGSTVMEILMAQASDSPPTFASIMVSDQVPAGVEEVVRSALAIKPEERPQSARALFEAYEAAVHRAYRSAEAPAPAAPDAASAPAHAASSSAKATRVMPALPDAPAPTDNPPSATDATVEVLEAFMPQQIAVHKLRGFVQEVGGKIIASMPGLIKVRLRVNPRAFKGTGWSGVFSWLGLGPKYVAMEMHMKQKEPGVLQITVMLRPEGGGPVPDNPDWRERCAIITNALKAYLMSNQ